MESHERDRQQRVVVLWLMKQGNRGKYKNLIRNFVLNVAFAIEDFSTGWEQKNPRAKESAEEYQMQRHASLMCFVRHLDQPRRRRSPASRQASR